MSTNRRYRIDAVMDWMLRKEWHLSHARLFKFWDWVILPYLRPWAGLGFRCWISWARREEAAESEPFTALPWPGAAAIILRDVPDFCATIRLWCLHELPFDVREYLGAALDALTEAAYTCGVGDRAGDGAGQGAAERDELPESWRVR